MTPARRCEARIGATAGDFGLVPVLCRQAVGIHAFIDATGAVRGACSIEGHESDVARRYGHWTDEIAPAELSAIDRHLTRVAS
jgi:hypothetical protein